MSEYFEKYGDYYDAIWDNVDEVGTRFLEEEVGLVPGEFKDWSITTGWRSPHTFLSECFERAPDNYSLLKAKVTVWREESGGPK